MVWTRFKCMDVGLLCLCPPASALYIYVIYVHYISHCDGKEVIIIILAS